MDFQPCGRRSGGHHLRQMRKTEPDARSLRIADRSHGSHPMPRLFRSLAAAHNAFAIPFGNIDPCLWIFIHLLGSSAGIVSRGGTVVLGSLGNTVALLGLKTR